MASETPRRVDTVIIGNGPAALILSYILHGHIPYYKGGHTDGLLDSKLSKRPCLLDLTPDLYAHFQSSLRYSSQALPVNTFLDTLLRPNADTEANPRSCVEWKYEPDRAVPHLVLGNSKYPGGQWADDPLASSWDIGTLSYAEMLSLPGYTFSDHYQATRHEPMPDFVRPSRKEVAEYLRAYPAAVGVADTLRNSVNVESITRSDDKFRIRPYNVLCDKLVLASGIFSINLPPPRQLEPLTNLHDPEAPLLVIGSGFSAADVIISASPTRKIIHLFKWQPDEHPSPLRGCHHQAYPEYAGIYRLMKLAVSRSSGTAPGSPALRRRQPPFLLQRDWASVYEGLPNAQILKIEPEGTQAKVSIRLDSGEVIERTVGELEYVVGRRGSLGYLSNSLLEEVFQGTDYNGGSNELSLVDGPPSTIISRRSLRQKAEVNLEVGSDVFVVGSLAGDSLIRHAFGTCVSVAATIIERKPAIKRVDSPTGAKEPSTAIITEKPIGNELPSPARTRDFGHSQQLTSSTVPAKRADHDDLHLDRRKLKRSREMESFKNETQPWRKPASWQGELCESQN